jgi:hypothetical protein|tara:strand:+ start:130 stop:561 length:432 start_codon:yes stop_codon:yes gene_type:complete
MESLFKQIETWLKNLIETTVDEKILTTDTKAIIEQQLSAAFEDETSFVTRYINILIDHKLGSNGQDFKANVRDVIDDYFDISQYDYEIREMAIDEVNQSFDINDHFDITDHFDINDYKDEIREAISNTFKTTTIDIVIPKQKN